MKLRIVRTDNYYYIQKRIFHFFKWETWMSYTKCLTHFNTLDEAKEKIKLIREEKLDKERKKNIEILRFDI